MEHTVSHILSTMRPHEPRTSNEIMSNVILKLFTSEVNPNAIDYFISQIPQQFATSRGTTILDEYIICEYYKWDYNYVILDKILKHDSSYLRKPHKIVDNKIFFVADLDLPSSMRQYIEVIPPAKKHTFYQYEEPSYEELISAAVRGAEPDYESVISSELSKDFKSVKDKYADHRFPGTYSRNDKIVEDFYNDFSDSQRQENVANAEVTLDQYFLGVTDTKKECVIDATYD